MCTVTYLPKTSSSYFLTHNRDEHFSRSIALLPQKKVINNIEIIAPTDSQAGGTWFAASNDFSLCLLNGGFQKHISTPPYRHSRGNVILDFFKFNDVELFFKQYSIQNIEPFTLIIVQNSTQQIFELVNDGIDFHKQEKINSEPHIWSSTTLYSPKEIQIRKTYFERFLEQFSLDLFSIISFHTNEFEQYEGEGIMINRENVLKTVSLTSLVKNSTIEMRYLDLVENKKNRIEL